MHVFPTTVTSFIASSLQYGNDCCGVSFIREELPVLFFGLISVYGLAKNTSRNLLLGSNVSTSQFSDVRPLDT